MNNSHISMVKNTEIIKTMPKHGSYVISSTKQLLTIKAYNDWNIETVISYCQSFKKEAMKIKNQPWSCLIDLSEWSLGPPEMLFELQKLHLWSEANNQLLEAVITKDSLQKQFFLKSHQAFKNTQSRFFDNKEDALFWLSSATMFN